MSDYESFEPTDSQVDLTSFDDEFETADAPSWSNSGVLRGATCAARARWRHPKSRRFALASTDTGPIGFRTCTL